MEEKNREETSSSLKFNQLTLFKWQSSPHIPTWGKSEGSIFSTWEVGFLNIQQVGLFFSTTSFLVLSSTPHLPNESAACVDMSHCSASIWSVLLTRSAPTCDNTLLSITSGLNDGLWLYLDTVIPNLKSTPNRYHFHFSLGSEWC